MCKQDLFNAIHDGLAMTPTQGEMDDLLTALKANGLVIMPASLTAENGAKGLLRGEFFEKREISNPEFCGESCSQCDLTVKCPEDHHRQEETVIQKTMISWTSIKAIYKRIVENLNYEAIDENQEVIDATEIMAESGTLHNFGD